MRDSSLRRVFALVVTLALTVLGARAIPQAIAADCGTGVGPCQCGDRVVTNTRLSAADPVLRTTCPGQGLIVASGVSLEIRGTMTGADDTGSAITLEGNATDVVVRNGRLTGFGVGINGDSLGAGKRQPLRRSSDSGRLRGRLPHRGRQPRGARHEPRRLRGRHLAAGQRQHRRLNRAEGAAIFGLSVIGDENTISRNVAQRNSGDGIAVAGEHTLLEANRSEYNGSAGFVLVGDFVTASGNMAIAHALDGFAVFASDSSLAGNRSDHNVFLGIADVGNGNTYAGNRCTGNGAGPSDPPGLCR